MEKEQFKPFPLNPNYEVSNKGNVYSKRSGIILKCGLSKDGYKQYGLPTGTTTAHRLVYKTWVSTIIPKGYVIDHVDGNRQNNTLENLELVTQKENIKRSLDKRPLKRRWIGKTGRKPNFSKEFIERQKKLLSSEANPEFKGYYIIDGVKYTSSVVPAKMLNVSSITIRRRCKNNTPGYSFEYVQKQ